MIRLESQVKYMSCIYIVHSKYKELDEILHENK